MSDTNDTPNTVESRRAFLRNLGKGAIAGGVVTMASGPVFTGKDEGMADQLRSDAKRISGDPNRVARYQRAAADAERLANENSMPVEKIGAATVAIGTGVLLTNKVPKSEDDPRFDEIINRRRRRALKTAAGLGVAGLTAATTIGTISHGASKDNIGRAEAIEKVEIPIDRAAGASNKEIRNKQAEAQLWREGADTKNNIGIGIALAGGAAMAAQVGFASRLVDEWSQAEQDAKKIKR